MIKDSRGKIPNFVVNGGRLVHQPTGISVSLVSKERNQIRDALISLKEMVADRGDS